MNSFFHTLLIIVLVIWGLRLFFRYVFPFLLARFISRKLSQMQNRHQHQNGTQPQNDGEIIIDKNVSQPKKHSKGSGEYVDFEEIK